MSHQIEREPLSKYILRTTKWLKSNLNYILDLEIPSLKWPEKLSGWILGMACFSLAEHKTKLNGININLWCDDIFQEEKDIYTYLMKNKIKTPEQFSWRVTQRYFMLLLFNGEITCWKNWEGKNFGKNMIFWEKTCQKHENMPKVEKAWKNMKTCRMATL